MAGEAELPLAFRWHRYGIVSNMANHFLLNNDQGLPCVLLFPRSKSSNTLSGIHSLRRMKRLLSKDSGGGGWAHLRLLTTANLAPGADECCRKIVGIALSRIVSQFSDSPRPLLKAFAANSTPPYINPACCLKVRIYIHYTPA